MKKKLVFRIFGALASALIIVSVFVPYVSAEGYSSSLFQTYQNDSIYLPIMIIAFGVMGVILFAANIKTEFAYMSVGAIAFFLVMQTIDILNQGVFNTLSYGYYFLVAGTLLTGIMAFIVNLKTSKKQKKEELVNQANEQSVLDQIDRLYNDQTTQPVEISPIQPINNIVEPIPVQPIETVTQEPVETLGLEVQQVPEIPVQQVNPVLQEFTAPQPVQQQVVTPVVPEVTPAMPVEQPVQQVNPVLQEFTNQSSSTNVGQQTDGLDIFNQPINK